VVRGTIQQFSVSLFVHTTQLPTYTSVSVTAPVSSSVSQNNIPDVFSYNSRKHCQIFKISGRNNREQVNNQNMLYFSTSLN